MNELRLAILGDPVAHSLSPALHRTAMRRLGLRGSYEAIQVRPAELPATLLRLKAQAMTGFNVTLPHKETIVPLLDELDEQAGELQSVNTVEIRRGVLYGCNTDRVALRQLLAGEGLRGEAGLLLGAGGSALAAAFALADVGLGRLSVLNRDVGRAQRLSARVAARFPGVEVRTGSLSDLHDVGAPAVVINATSLGLRPADETPLGRSFWSRGPGLAVDLVYGEHARFLGGAREGGWHTLDGLTLLVRQGLLALQIWSGARLPDGFDAEILADLGGSAR
jgi:shikimate dehydrogenase